jgi:hypothetical protein
VWARFRYPVLGPVSGERPMRATMVIILSEVKTMMTHIMTCYNLVNDIPIHQIIVLINRVNVVSNFLTY